LASCRFLSPRIDRLSENENQSMPGPSIISSAMAIAAAIVNLGIPLVVIEAASLPLTRILIF